MRNLNAVVIFSKFRFFCRQFQSENCSISFNGFAKGKIYKRGSTLFAITFSRLLNFFYRNCQTCFVRKYLCKLRYTYSLHRRKPNLRSKRIYFNVGANRTFPIFYTNILCTEKITFSMFSSVSPMHNRYRKCRYHIQQISGITMLALKASRTVVVKKLGKVITERK
jgi:hypothetical protein